MRFFFSRTVSAGLRKGFLSTILPLPDFKEGTYQTYVTRRRIKSRILTRE
jgi:hypothetical protein